MAAIRLDRLLAGHGLTLDGEKRDTSPISGRCQDTTRLRREVPVSSYQLSGVSVMRQRAAPGRRLKHKLKPGPTAGRERPDGDGTQVRAERRLAPRAGRVLLPVCCRRLPRDGEGGTSEVGSRQ